MRTLSLLFASLTLGFSVGTLPASFDCAKASSRIDNAICASAQVSKLDNELDAAYRSALARSNDPDGVRAAQRAWLKQTRNQCQDEQCLVTVYSERRAALNAFPTSISAASASDAGAPTAEPPTSPASRPEVVLSEPDKRNVPVVSEARPTNAGPRAPEPTTNASGQAIELPPAVETRTQPIIGSGKSFEISNPLLGLAVFGSAVWVYQDAKRRGIRRRGTGKLIDIGPLGWGASVLFLWIVAFPLYLLNRTTLSAPSTQAAQPISAPIVQETEKSSGASNLLKWALVVVGGLMVVGYLSKNEGTSRSVEVSTESRDTYRTTAGQLFSDYERNEVAADEKMRGRTVEVTGIVQAIDKDFTDSIIISLQTENEFMPARMQVIDSEKQAAISLEKGASIKVVCERMMRVVGSPSGRSCTFRR